MPLQRPVAAVLLLVAAAACTGSAPSPVPSSPAAPPSSSASSPGPVATPPDLAAPAWVRSREPLPFCGLELQPDALNVEARRCFLDAAAAGQPAEMLVRVTTIEGGTVQYLYRTTPGNPFEQIIDGTGDPYGSGRWERLVCIRLTRGEPMPDDPTGRLNFAFESCEDATPSG